VRKLIKILRRRDKPLQQVSIAEGVGFEDPLETRLKVRRREEAFYLS
jgi:hypothetical protein